MVGQAPAESVAPVLPDPVLEMLLTSILPVTLADVVVVVVVVAVAGEGSVLRQEGGEEAVDVGLVLLALPVQTFQFVPQLPEAPKAAFENLLSGLELMDSTFVLLWREK